jgi:hypothetical protein
MGRRNISDRQEYFEDFQDKLIKRLIKVPYVPDKLDLLEEEYESEEV